MLFLFLTTPERAKKGHCVQAKHIECRKERPCCPQNIIDRAFPKSRRKDLIFGKKAGERRNTGNGQACEKKSNMGNREMFFQSSHLADILLATQGMND